jgi:hypothetical protein
MRVGRKKHVVAGKTLTIYGRRSRSRGTGGQARIKRAAACCDHSINKLHKLINSRRG